MLDPDKILDRRRIKRWLVIWRTVAVIGLVVIAALIASYFTDKSSLNNEYIARLWINDIILENPIRDQELLNIAQNESVKALIVRINSPGGSMAGSEALYLSLRKISKTKPVVAVLSGVAASGGYLSALATDRIFARKSTVTGSIGVILQTAEISEMLEHIGVSTEAVKSSPLKGTPSTLETMNQKTRQAAQAVVDDMYILFLNILIERRALERAAATKLADGRIFTGRQALRNGLIDEIGGEQEALAWINKNSKISPSIPIRDVEIDTKSDIIERIFSSATNQLVPIRLKLDGLVAVWQP